MIFNETISAEEIERIKEKTWYRHGIYRDNILATNSWMVGIEKKDFAQEWLDIGMNNVIKIDEQAYITEDEFLEFSNLMFDKISNEPDYLNLYIRKYRKENKNAILVALKIKKKFTKSMEEICR